MIITVTPNTAIDHCITLAGLGSQDTLLASDCAEYACGKGVNVAKAVAAQGVAVRCLGFVGSRSWATFQALGDPLLQADFTEVAGATRSNITLHDTATGKETHIRTPGFTVSSDDCQRLQQHLAATVQAGDIVVLSGSLPPGAPPDLYRSLIAECQQQGALALLDSNGVGLAEGIKARPYLVKPNQHELQELLGQPLPDLPATIAAACQVVAAGVAWVYVSRGADGLLVVGKDSVLNVSSGTPPGGILSQIGCGDALVAGLAVAILQGQPVADAAKIGVACATASLSSLEPGRFDARLLPDIIRNIEISEL